MRGQFYLDSRCSVWIWFLEILMKKMIETNVRWVMILLPRNFVDGFMTTIGKMMWNVSDNQVLFLWSFFNQVFSRLERYMPDGLQWQPWSLQVTISDLFGHSFLQFGEFFPRGNAKASPFSSTRRVLLKRATVWPISRRNRTCLILIGTYRLHTRWPIKTQSSVNRKFFRSKIQLIYRKIVQNIVQHCGVTERFTIAAWRTVK